VGGGGGEKFINSVHKDVTEGQTDERKVALLHVYPFATSLAMR
jgi:hypothetical protein